MLLSPHAFYTEFGMPALTASTQDSVMQYSIQCGLSKVHWPGLPAQGQLCCIVREHTKPRVHDGTKCYRVGSVPDQPSEQSNTVGIPNS